MEKKHREFLKYFVKLLRLKDGIGKYDAGLEAEKLQGKTNVLYKDWLESKFAYLIPRQTKNLSM